MLLKFNAKQNTYMFHRIVDRCHVAESNLRVIKYVISRFKRKYKTWASFDKQERKKALGIIIKQHSKNKKLYSQVMRGIF